MLQNPAGVPAGLLFDWALPVIHPPPPAHPPAPAARPQPRKPDVGAQVTGCISDAKGSKLSAKDSKSCAVLHWPVLWSSSLSSATIFQRMRLH